jgi:hypothetical protein
LEGATRHQIPLMKPPDEAPEFKPPTVSNG